jgi:hypothetical protein
VAGVSRHRRKIVASHPRDAQHFHYAPSILLRRLEEEALAALPGGTGPGALTARTATKRASGTGGSRGRGHQAGDRGLSIPPPNRRPSMKRGTE